MAWVNDVRERSKTNIPLMIVIITGIINVSLSIVLAAMSFRINPVMALVLPLVTTATSVWVIYNADCVEVGKCRPASWIIAATAILLTLTQASTLNAVRILSK